MVDPLDEYRRKRNFNTTPEPFGDPIIDARRARLIAKRGYYGLSPTQYEIVPGARDTNDLLAAIANRTGAKVNDYSRLREYNGDLDREEIDAAHITGGGTRDEVAKRFREEASYALPSAMSTIGSGVFSVLGTAIARSVARNAAAAVAGAILGTAIVASVWGSKVVVRAFGPWAAGFTVTNIWSAALMILAAMHRNYKRENTPLPEIETINEPHDVEGG